MEANITLKISSSEIAPSYFEVGETVNGLMQIRYLGKIEELADNFAAVGVIRDIRIKNGDIYILINEADKNKFLPGN